MEKSLEFNSQICTTKEQSKRLLALGLKKETADMYITNMSSKGLNYTDDWQIGTISYCDVISFWDSKGLQLEKTAWSIIPAWSLHRLMLIADANDTAFLNIEKMYETLIKMIASNIKYGFINKDYLEEQKQ